MLTVYHQSQKISLLTHASIIPKDITSRPQVAKPAIHLADYYIFGNPALSAQSKETVNWTLRGIIIDKNDKNTAVLGTSDLDEATYNVGDRLSDGSIVMKILPDQVMLSRDGQIETLTIDWQTEKADLNIKSTDED